MTPNVADEEISRVLFELSSNRRADMLLEIKKEKLKSQQIAKLLDMTVNETFRHLQRLTEAELVEKKVDGTYALTPLGEVALGFLSGFNFVLDNRRYFLEHDVSALPYEFVNRLSELSAGKYSGDVLSSLNLVRKMVFDAEKYIYVMADQVDSSHVEATNQRVARGMKFRFIMQENLAKAPMITPEVERLKERRVMQRIPVVLLVNEKEAAVGLRRSSGELDYTCFFSSDPKFRRWAKDLFVHQWRKAQRWRPTR